MTVGVNPMSNPNSEQILARIRAFTLSEIRHTPQDDPRDDYEHEYYTRTEIDQRGDEAADRYERERGY